DSTFTPRLAAGLTAMGFDEEASQDVAEEIAQTDPDANLAQGVKSAVAALTTPSPVRRRNPKKAPELPADRFDECPDDYRRAIAHARAKNIPVLEQLKAFGMAPLLEDILEL